MAKQLQLRRGSYLENETFIGAEAEMTFDTEKKDIRIHDGVKRGGYKIPTLVDSQIPTAENGYTWYRRYADGWVEQGGIFNNVSTGGWQAAVTVSLPVEMANNMYAVTWTNGWNDYTDNCPTIKNRTTTTFIAARPLCIAVDAVASWTVSGISKQN